MLGDRSISWLAERTGIKDQTLRDAIARGPSRSDIALKIAGALDVSLDWLLTGKKQMNLPDEVWKLEQEDVVRELGLAMIPEVDIAYSMGAGAVVGDYVESRMVPFRADWLNRITRGRPAEVFLTSGQGDSMMPTILDDDDVLVNRADNVVQHQDRIWAVGYGDLGMIKRVRRLPGGQFRLLSDNAAVAPIDATEDEIFIVGRVIWIGRRV